MSQIIFNEKKDSLSLGRNGYVWMDGVQLDSLKNAVQITVINSRGHLSPCTISIPSEHLQEFINELEKFKL